MTELSEYCKKINCEIKLDEPLKNHTTFKIGGSCNAFLKPSNKNQLIELIKYLINRKLDFLLMGNGSNMLITDDHLDKIVVCIAGNCSEIHPSKDGLNLYCESGASLQKICTTALELGLSGMEFAYGIPGRVGAAIVMNAGAYDGEMANVVKSVEFLDIDGTLKTYERAELDFSYRHSIFEKMENSTILSCIIRLQQTKKTKIRSKMDDLLRRRQDKQPLDLPNAGSIFKRPKNGFAAAMIDECGLKGTRIGGACVSEKHSGFIVNTGNASFNDVVELIDLIKNKVFQKFGVLLETEIRIIQNN